MRSIPLGWLLHAAATIAAMSGGEVHAAAPEPAHEEVSQPATNDAPSAAVDGLLQPTAISGASPENVPPPAPEELTIEQLVAWALCSNPSVAQAAARVDALRGKWVQAGLPPNPTAGYVASEVGNDGRGGQQGGFAGQDFITGGKLRLDQAVVAGEIQQAQQQLYAAQLRVITDVRRAGYAVLVAQRRVELAEELLEASSQAVTASRELVQAQEISRAGLLQSEVEQQTTSILAQTARAELEAAWRQLSAVVGNEIPQSHLAGDVTQLPTALDFDEQLARVTAASPELGAAVADVFRARRALDRALVEPIPNVETQVSVQYDDSSDNTIAGLQVGVPLPLWNRNQGGVRQSQAEIREARRNADRVELDLKRRLAEAFRRYATARAQAETYATNILPKSRETFELVQRGFQLGEVAYVDLLTAQRTFSQTNLAYLDALSSVWLSWIEIDGLLLSGSLTAPPR